jgi:hypothetical protein
MTYRRLEKKLDVTRFVLDIDYSAIVKKRDNLFVYKNNTNNLFIINSVEFVGYINNLLIIKDYEGVGYKINLDTFYLEKIENSGIKFNGKNESNLLPIFRSQSIFDPVENGIFDIVNNKINFISENCKSNQIIDNYFVGIFNEILFSNSLNTGDYLWSFEFNFPKYYREGYCDYRETQLEKFIGVYEDELWILFSGNRILVLDIHTGEERHQFESLNKTLDTSFFINNCFLDKTTGVIKILAYLYYIEIDTKTKEAFIKKDFKNFSMVNGSYYGGDTIYFVGNNNKSQSISNNITGIFNTKTLEIDWSYELEVKDKNHFFVDVPQANATHFGIKDSENTLYLFERE